MSVKSCGSETRLITARTCESSSNFFSAFIFKREGEREMGTVEIKGEIAQI